MLINSRYYEINKILHVTLLKIQNDLRTFVIDTIFEFDFLMAPGEDRIYTTYQEDLKNVGIKLNLSSSLF